MRTHWLRRGATRRSAVAALAIGAVLVAPTAAGAAGPAPTAAGAASPAPTAAGAAGPAAGAAGPASAAGPTGPAAGTDSTRGATQRIDAQENDRALAHWTPERMRTSRTVLPRAHAGTGAPAPVERGRPDAVPPGMPVRGAKDAAPDAGTTAQSTAATTATATSTSSSASEGYWQGSNTANPNRQIGRLFYQQWDPVSSTWKDYSCSGTVVNSENRSVVWTAGHCVFQTWSNVWNRNYLFCPGYRNGDCALGRWTPYSQSTTTQWQSSTCSTTGSCTFAEFAYDFGALKMNAINGYRIANWVGSHGIDFNGATYQHRYLFGYPLNKASGQYLYYCAGTNTYSNANLRLSCTAGPGASGGPWLSSISSSWLGYVRSVNSHGDGTYMGGPYQGTVAQNLFGTVRY